MQLSVLGLNHRVHIGTFAFYARIDRVVTIILAVVVIQAATNFGQICVGARGVEPTALAGVHSALISIVAVRVVRTIGRIKHYYVRVYER